MPNFCDVLTELTTHPVQATILRVVRFCAQGVFQRHCAWAPYMAV